MARQTTMEHPSGLRITTERSVDAGQDGIMGTTLRVRVHNLMLEDDVAMRPNRGNLIVLAASVAVLSGCGNGRETSHERADAAFQAIGAVLPSSEANGILTACDGTTAAADSLWAPPASVLRALEVRLVDHMKRASARSKSADPLQVYSRQYLGLYRDGRLLVFVNGVHLDYLRIVAERDTGRKVPMSVRMQRVAREFREWAVHVCDGGEMFFHAEYDVAADSISMFTYNNVT